MSPHVTPPAVPIQDVITREECERVHRGTDAVLSRLGSAVEKLSEVAVRLETVVGGLSRDKDNRGSLGRSIVGGVAVGVVMLAVGYAVGKHR